MEEKLLCSSLRTVACYISMTDKACEDSCSYDTGILADEIARLLADSISIIDLLVVLSDSRMNQYFEVTAVPSTNLRVHVVGVGGLGGVCDGSIRSR